jgi:hypothetical protein
VPARPLASWVSTVEGRTVLQVPVWRVREAQGPLVAGTAAVAVALLVALSAWPSPALAVGVLAALAGAWAAVERGLGDARALAADTHVVVDGRLGWLHHPSGSVPASRVTAVTVARTWRGLSIEADVAGERWVLLGSIPAARRAEAELVAGELRGALGVGDGAWGVAVSRAA